MISGSMRSTARLKTDSGAADVAFFRDHGEIIQMQELDRVWHSGSPSLVAPCGIRRAAYSAMQVRRIVTPIVGA